MLIVPKARSARDVWWVDVLLTQLEAKLRLTRPIGNLSVNLTGTFRCCQAVLPAGNR